MMDEENLSHDSSSSASAKTYRDLEDDKKWKQVKKNKYLFCSIFT